MKIFGFFVVFVIVFTCGYRFQEARRGERTREEDSSDRQMSSQARSRVESQQRAAEVRELSEKTFQQGGAEQWLRWLGRLERAKIDEMPSFYEGAGENRTALDLVAAKWASLNPQHGFQFLLENIESDSYRYGQSGASERDFIGLFFEHWMERDIEGALAALDHDGPSTMVKDLQRKMMRELFQRDPEAALVHGTRWRSSMLQDEVPRPIEEWMKNEPRRAAEILFELPSNHFLTISAQIWAESQPRTAMQFAQQKGGDRGQQFGRTVFGEWLRSDFREAAAWYHSLAEGEDRFSSVFAKEWGKLDPLAALAWSQNELRDGKSHEAVKEVALASLDAPGSVTKELLESIASPVARELALEALGNRIWRKGWSSVREPLQEEALEWFAELENSHTTGKVFHLFANYWAHHDHEGYVEYFTSEKSHSLAWNDFEYGLSRMMFQEPEKGMDFLLEAPERFLSSATANGFDYWYQLAPEQAVAWAEQLSSDDLRRPHLVADFQSTYYEAHEIAVERINAFPPVIKDLLREDLRKKQESGKVQIANGREIDFEGLLRETAGD